MDISKFVTVYNRYNIINTACSFACRHTYRVTLLYLIACTSHTSGKLQAMGAWVVWYRKCEATRGDLDLDVLQGRVGWLAVYRKSVVTHKVHKNIAQGGWLATGNNITKWHMRWPGVHDYFRGGWGGWLHAGNMKWHMRWPGLHENFRGGWDGWLQEI